MEMIWRIKKKYDHLSIPAKASIWFILCGVLKDAVDILTTPIFTRMLSPEQYGYFNVYNSWFQIGKILFTLYLFGSVFNVGLSRYTEDRDRFISSSLGFMSACTAAYFVIYLLFRSWFEELAGLPSFLIVVLFGHVIFYATYYCWLRRERYDYHYKRIIIVSFLYIILQPILGIISILFLDEIMDPGYLRILAAVGVQIVIGTVLYIQIFKKGKAFYDTEYWQYSIKNGIELFPYHFSNVFLNQLDRIMINRFSGPGDVAVYSVTHSVAFILQIVTEALNGAFVPWLYRKLKEKDLQGIKDVVTGMTLFIGTCVFLVEMIAPEIVMILGSKSYQEGVNCIPFLTYSVFLIFLYTLFTDIELYYGRNKSATLIATAGMLVNLVLNYYLIPRFGYLAAAFTTMASYLLICIGHFLSLRQCVKQEKIRVNDLIDMKKVSFLSSVVFMLTLLCAILYEYPFFRYGILLIICIVVLFNRDKWIGLIRRMREGVEDE